jgi:hypothetical protein
VLSSSGAGVRANVFAPCLHQRACPALAVPGEWCHEDLAVDLPSWLVPVARAAGLRYQGLTFSYLVLRKDGRPLERELGRAPSHGVRLRTISDRIVTKGKSEVLGCTAEGERRRFRRLDRDRSDANARWDEVARGDVLCITEAEERIGPNAAIDVWRGKN